MCWICIALFLCPEKDPLKGSLSVVFQGTVYSCWVFDGRLAGLLQLENSRLFGWKPSITQESPQCVSAAPRYLRGYHTSCWLMPCSRWMLEVGISWHTFHCWWCDLQWPRVLRVKLGSSSRSNSLMPGILSFGLSIELCKCFGQLVLGSSLLRKLNFQRRRVGLGEDPKSSWPGDTGC